MCFEVTANPLSMTIAYLTQEKEIPPALSNLDPIISDKGLQGARLGVIDNNTTGRFTKQRFLLQEVIVPIDGDVNLVFKSLVSNGIRQFISNLPAQALSDLIDLTEVEKTLVFDISTSADIFRSSQCKTNVFHLLPSRAMRADALAQYMLKKRWNTWFLVIGPTPQDRLYAAALKRAAKRFGMLIVEEKTWEHTYDARRTAQSEVPVFTQGVDYDVLVVADEVGLFGEYLSYRTWLPRPVIGSQGLVPTAWSRTHEQWGAVQLQNRFRKQANRWMTEVDYAAWLAARAIGEAATRTRSIDSDAIKAFILSDEFGLAGFKGRKLSFRKWNNQLRQPVLLASDRSMVSVAPIEGFLHPKNELDTLGFDAPETTCDL